MLEGRIKSVNSHGYGFIETDRKIDFYFHHTQYKGDWKILLKRYVCDEILIVEFDNNVDASEGPQAINVRVKTSLDKD